VRDIIRTPSTGDPPLRVYAWDEAIYVTCPGAGAWGEYCNQLTGVDEGAWLSGGSDAAPAARGTLGPNGMFSGLDPAARSEMEELMKAAKVRELMPSEHDRLRELADSATAAPTAVPRKLRLPETAQAEAVRRLQYLCRLIRRDRRPWCPLNGVLLLVPWAATESDEAARAGSGVMQRDLNAVRATLRQRYPTCAVVCDLETARGFPEFRSGFPPDILQQRIGQRLPLGPDVDPPSIPGVISSAVQWVGSSVLPAWIHRFLQLGPIDPRLAPMSGSPHNRNLYLLMRAVFDRGPRLAQLLSRGLPPVNAPVGDPAAGLPLFGGCYLAGTGKTPETQAFVPGVFQRMSEMQNLVSWSPEATAEDTRLNRMTAVGYVVIVLLLVLAVAGFWRGLRP
jgi:IcmF-related N-terminal domain